MFETNFTLNLLMNTENGKCSLKHVSLFKIVTASSGSLQRKWPHHAAFHSFLAHCIQKRDTVDKNACS